MAKMKREDLEKVASVSTGQQYIKVGVSTCGVAAGAQEVYDVFVKEIKYRDLQIELKKAGCVGMCHSEPLVEVNVEGLPVVTYGRVDKDVALRILEEHVCGKRLLNDHIYDLPVRR
jgi:NADP-reducing hydrogenase subunit HndB